MTHWERYWTKKQHIAKKLCSNLPTIDSFQLYKGDEILAGFLIDPFEVKAMLASDHLVVTYRNRKEHSYIIPIDKLPCHYGGFRYFFKCPLCQKRMRFLYFGAQSLFLCRGCLNLGYTSQRLCPSDRYDYMSEKVKKFIDGKGGNLSFDQKPPRMHRATYEKLRRKEVSYMLKCHQALEAEYG